MHHLDKESKSRETIVSEPAAPAYLPPRIVPLGKANDLIRGAYSDGYEDSTHDWYSTGE
jgi:hypothetical protein